MKVFVVFSSEEYYGDRFQGVFLTREKAEAFAKEYIEDENERCGKIFKLWQPMTVDDMLILEQEAQ